MNKIFIPRRESFIFIEEQILPRSNSWQTLRLKMTRPVGYDEHASGVYNVSTGFAVGTMILHPGEWYQIKNVSYLPQHVEEYPILTIALQRSFHHREWVKEKIQSVIDHQLNAVDPLYEKGYCSDRNIYVHSGDLNNKAWIIDTYKEAVEMRKKFLLGDVDPQKTRFQAIASE